MAKGKGARAGEQKRQIASTEEILKPGYNMPDNYNDLVRVYRTLAKSADQRLVRLEQYSNQKNFKTAIKWSYARAQRDIKAWSGQDATRFNTKPPKSESALRSKIEDIKTFLKAPSSTKKGIIDVYKKKAETFNRNHGTNFTWQQMGKFFESGLAKKMQEDMDSTTMAKVIATISKNKKNVIQQIEEQDQIDIKAPDSMTKELVFESISKYGEDVLEALGWK